MDTGQTFGPGTAVVVGGISFNQFSLGQGVLLIDLDVTTTDVTAPA